MNYRNKTFTTVIKNVFIAIPGGVMNVPLILGMFLNTFFPQVLKIGTLTTALFHDSSLTLLGLLFFLAGTQFQFNESVKVWTNSFILLIYKAAIGVVSYFLAYALYGYEGAAGITPLVLLIALTQPNIAMYNAVTLQFGNPIHLRYLPLFALILTPLILGLVLNNHQMVQVSFMNYISMLLPFVLGTATGYIFQQNRAMLYKFIPWVIPFFAFSIGAHFHLSVFLQAGFSAILIAAIVLASGIGGFFLIRMLATEPNATSGIAIGSTASASIVLLPLIKSNDSQYNNLLPVITSQLVVVVILTCIFCPILAKYLQRFNKQDKCAKPGYIKNIK